jgi:4'-phosphopantetheinyl transferase
LYHLDVNSETENWTALRDRPSLNTDEIHLWKIALDDPAPKPDVLYNEILSEDEKNRARGFRYSEYRGRFVTGRAYLRKLLGTYLNTDPRDIFFEYNEHGKPEIPARSNPGEIEFNLAHSRNLALFAFTKNTAVGIDIEFVRQVMRPEKILERFFPEGERNYYHSQPETMKMLTFLKLWTIREAYSKAVGTGFSSKHKEIDLLPALKGSLPASASISHTKHPGKWSILEIAPGAGYIGAVAYRGDAKRICYFLV